MEQKQLSLLINTLPHILQIVISEYNVEHRQKMKNVLSELTEYTPYTLICEGCDIGKIGIVLYSVLAANFICSKKCLKTFVGSIPYGCPDKHAYDDML